MKNSVVTPLSNITAHVLSVRKDGKLTSTFNSDLVGRGDEIGVLAREFGTMLREIDRAQKEIVGLSEAKLASRTQQLDAALNNMSHGLCMFDQEQRLVICNQQFGSMYGLPADLTAPGTLLTDILAHRLRGGVATVPHESFVKSELALLESEHTTSTVVLEDGRTIAINSAFAVRGGVGEHS